MPIVVSVFEPQIIYQQWSGHISVTDMEQLTRDALALKEHNAFQNFVAIIDGQHVQSIEMDLRAIRRVTDRTATSVGIYVINPPYIGTVLVKIMSGVVRQKEIRVCTSMQQALIYGRARLKAVALHQQSS